MGPGVIAALVALGLGAPDPAAGAGLQRCPASSTPRLAVRGEPSRAVGSSPDAATGHPWTSQLDPEPSRPFTLPAAMGRPSRTDLVLAALSRSSAPGISRLARTLLAFPLRVAWHPGSPAGPAAPGAPIARWSISFRIAL